MKKKDLVNYLESLDFDEGFKIVSDTFIFGVKRVNLIDTNSIVFAAYGGELFPYWLETLSYEEIADEIEEYISGFEAPGFERNLTLNDCTVAML